ncbi:MAG: hypothetical protein RL736_905, partial [Pseudomonadota bacterium]
DADGDGRAGDSIAANGRGGLAGTSDSDPRAAVRRRKQIQYC